MKRWLRYLWENEDGFFGIGMGPTAQETGLGSSLAAAGNFATGEGEGDILASDQFWKAILSGDPGQISKVLGPTMSAINKQGQQSKKTNAEFGNRGGGTNAANQMTDDNTRTAIDSAIASLTGSAASNLGSGGRGLLSTGVSADTSAFNAAETIQQQKSNKWNDIFKSTADVVAAPFTGGASLGDLGGGFKGGADEIMKDLPTNRGGGTGGGGSSEFPWSLDDSGSGGGGSPGQDLY